MTVAAPLAPAHGALPLADKRLTAKIWYTAKPPADHEPLEFFITAPTPQGKAKRNYQDVPAQVEVSNIRSLQQKPSLHVNGFEVVPFTVPEGIDWTDKKQAEGIYFPAVEAMLKERTGATRVHVFDYTARTGGLNGTPEDLEQISAFDKNGFGQPVPLAHIDYDRVSGPERLKGLLPDEAERLTRTPFAIIQMWHTMKDPIMSAPLAFMDAQSAAPEDFLPVALHFKDRVGRIQAVLHNSKQQWYFADRLAAGEAYLWVGYDSRQGNACFVPHSSFRDPTVGPNPPPRESVESRAYVFWEND